ncbi:hypothetical protein [Chryseolinea lacunae]|uniref:Peptidase n=1 Tax=Chryseolinea lacunae TaxID=2801331 RepID=A0ABS1L235_9BACT|nr:hypothetical protein [Chryseolinea lacunae]MBL0745572.1 hypothetical protein [Chryseolinea lacunae]
MKRAFYHRGIFFIALLVVAVLFQHLIRFQLGDEITRLNTFGPWLFSYGANAALATFFVLKYYQAKHYRVAFITGTISIVVSLAYLLLNYAIIVSPAQFVPFAVPAFVLAVVASSVAAASLVFSGARKNRLLFTAGLLMLILAIAIATAILSYNVSPNISVRNTLKSITQGLSFLYDLTPLFFIVIFWNESKALPPENSDWQPDKTFNGFWSIAGTLAFMLTFVFGAVLANETHGKLAWEKHLDQKDKEWSKLFQSRTFVGSRGDTLHYQLLPPLNADPQKKYPLVVCLPYNSGVRGCPPAQALLSQGNRTKHPAFLFVPRCPEGSGWGGIPHYPTIDTLVFNAILALEAELNTIDQTRRYVTGVSRGGYGSWHFICTRPQMFAAAIPVCGGEDPNLAANSVGVAVWAFHGGQDRNVLVQKSRDMIEGMKKAGGNPRYTEFPNAGHDIWDKVNNTPGLWEWLFEQRRDSVGTK